MKSRSTSNKTNLHVKSYLKFKLLFWVLMATIVPVDCTLGGESLAPEKVSCDSKDLVRCVELGNVAIKSGNLAEARRLFQQACDGKEMRGCNGVGLLDFQAGNKNEATRLFKLACDGKELRGCVSLGRFESEQKNKAEAKRLFKKACDGGNSDGCNFLGVLENETGNKDEAIKLFKTACTGGVAGACNDLGINEEKLGNKQTAKGFYKQSCDGGYLVACNNLGILEGDEKHVDEAKRLFKIACDGGNKSGCNNLNVVNGKGPSKAESSGFAEGSLIKGRCYPTFAMGYVVNQKIDKNHYGAVTTQCPPLSCHAIIELSNFNPNLTGPVNALVERTGTTTIKLSNGFDAPADIFKECLKFHACGEHGQYRCVGEK